MKSKLSALLIAAYLMVGCSSGGGTSGAGGGSATTTDEFLLTASLVMDEGGNTEIDTTECAGGEPFTIRSGTFTIGITNIASLTGGLFPSGIILTSYSVSFKGQSSGAPRIPSKTYGNSSNQINGATLTTTVIIVDIASTFRNIVKSNPSGTVHRYTTTVAMSGRSLSGDPFTVSAVVILGIGNFTTCTEEVSGS